jgi:hypothetical protein
LVRSAGVVGIVGVGGVGGKFDVYETPRRPPHHTICSFRTLLNRSLDSAAFTTYSPHNRTAQTGALIQQSRRARSAAV